jgi:outer membrane protein TolC
MKNAFPGRPMEHDRTMTLLQKRIPHIAFVTILAVVPFTPLALGQMSNGNSSGSSEAAPGAAALPAAPSASISSQNPFLNSVPEGKATSEVLAISFKDAIDRGLRNNLGVLLQSDTSLALRGQKWKELSALLPNVSGGVSENVAKIDLAAQGFRFSGPAFAGIPQVVGPFGFFDARLYWSQTVFDLNAFRRERGAAENEQAQEFNYKNARDLVVLAVGNAYLESLAGYARVQTAEAQVTTAQALYDRAVDQQQAGVAPAIDVLRAHVELQSRQQQLIVARNDFAKEKLTLARTIGLPPGQEFTLSDQAPYEPLVAMSIDEALRRAYAFRSDYLAAAQQLKAAQYFRRAATAEHYPTLEIGGNFGDSAITPGSPEEVYQAAATLKIPIFAGGKATADALQAEATLRQDEQQLDNLRGQIDYEVRTALLDLQAAADQVKVATSSVDLANQTLLQAKDRFSAGVADNLEVVQAQEAVASANESYISSLYAHNLAKVELARAIGYAEEGVRRYLQTKKP